MKSAERRMKILLMLQSKKSNITIDYLADYFNVSRRTIFRDLRMLQELEVPVAYDGQSGYSIPRGYNIPPLMFTQKEVATILVGLSFVKSQPDPSMVDDAKAVELKIENLLPAELRNWMQVLKEKVIVDPYFISNVNETNGGNWYQLANAISQQFKLTFIYKNKRRTLIPYAIIYFGDHWTVSGHYPQTDEIRSFRLESMHSIEVSQNTSMFRKDTPPIKDLIYRKKSDTNYQIKLTVDIGVWNEFNRTYPAKILFVNRLDDCIKLESEFDNLEYINKWLLRFGTDLEINGPQELIQLREDLLRDMMAKKNGKRPF
jgi:predicted DNA-binding transcriptional regulator YafY